MVGIELSGILSPNLISFGRQATSFPMLWTTSMRRVLHTHRLLYLGNLWQGTESPHPRINRVWQPSDVLALLVLGLVLVRLAIGAAQGVDLNFGDDAKYVVFYTRVLPRAHPDCCTARRADAALFPVALQAGPIGYRRFRYLLISCSSAWRYWCGGRMRPVFSAQIARQRSAEKSGPRTTNDSAR